MSKAQRIIDLQVPEGLQPKKMEETIISRNHVCSSCHGSGYYWGMDELGQYMHRPCTLCGGRGSLDAVVSIKWIRIKK